MAGHGRRTRPYLPSFEAAGADEELSAGVEQTYPQVLLEF